MQAFTGSVFTMAVAGMIGVLTHQPWLFPSLGPTVMLHVEKPDAPESSPRDTLIRDLQDLYLMAAECDICWTVVRQAARGVRDEDLQHVVQTCEGETATQLKWLRTRMKQAAPQALIVAG
jgi:hypothetical protein